MIKSNAQMMRKISLLNSDFNILPGIQQTILDRPATIRKPEIKVPSPKEKAQSRPSITVFEITVISKSRAISGAHGDIPEIKPKINRLLKVNVLLTEKPHPQ